MVMLFRRVAVRDDANMRRVDAGTVHPAPLRAPRADAVCKASHAGRRPARPAWINAPSSMSPAHVRRSRQDTPAACPISRVERAAAIAGAVERDVGEAERAQRGGEFAGRSRAESAAGHFILGDFDARETGVIAHAELAEAESAQMFLRPLDAAQRLARDRVAVGRCARRGRPTPACPRPAGPASRASSRMSALVRAPHRPAGAMTPWSFAACWPGPEIAAVVEVHAVGEGGEIPGGPRAASMRTNSSLLQ